MMLMVFMTAVLLFLLAPQQKSSLENIAVQSTPWHWLGLALSLASFPTAAMIFRWTLPRNPQELSPEKSLRAFQFSHLARMFVLQFPTFLHLGGLAAVTREASPLQGRLDTTIYLFCLFLFFALGIHLWPTVQKISGTFNKQVSDFQ